MDGSDLTERSHRRRLSSILKAPRSPLRDLGFGNGLFQDTTLEKRRKSSRRVSFAETIRVFNPELQANAVPDTENRDIGTIDSCIVTKNSECQITGIDNLLHGPIQVPAHQTEWNYQDCSKDRTIFFSSDMDITTSNTVAIDGLMEAKPKKTDTSLFLASLKSQNTEESISNVNLPFSLSGQKHAGFHNTTGSSVPTKIKFGDFLASLQIEKTKTENTKSTICFDGDDKENIFHYVSKENVSVNKSIPLVVHTLENTGNVTHMFKEQENGLDLTKCYTTNITTFMPLLNSEFLGNKCINAISEKKDQTLKDYSHLKQSGSASNSHTSVSDDKTVFLKEDMDLTCSHTTRIDGVLWESNAHRRDTCGTNQDFPNDQTIIFTDKNEMEMTKNKFVSVSDHVFSAEGPTNCFGMGDTTVFPEEDMDITSSHTVAINGVTIDQLRKQSSTCSITKKVPAMCEELTKKDVGGSFNAEKSIPNKFDFYTDGAGTRLSQGNAFIMNSKEACQQEEIPVKPANPLNHCTKQSVSDLEEDQHHSKPTSIEEHVTNNKKSHEITLVYTSAESLPPSEKTVLFTCDQDDMELTKSHTIAIDGKLLEESKKPNHISKDKRSLPGGLRLSSVLNKTDFFSNDNDMEQMQRQTNCADRNTLNGNTFLKFCRTEAPGFKGGVFKENQASNTTGINNTLLTDGQENMDLNQLHNFAVTGEAQCTRLQSNICAGNNTKTEMSLNNTDKLLPGMSSGTEHSILQDNSVFPPGNYNMNSTNLNTVATKNTFLCEYSQINKTIQYIPPSTSWPDKTIVFESDMELTKTHTVISDGKKPAVLQNPLTSVKSWSCASGPDEMDITKSNTIFIDNAGTNVMSEGAFHTTKIISRRSSVAHKSEYPIGDMEMTNVNVGKLITCGIAQSSENGTTFYGSTGDKTLCPLDKDDMDITRAHTVAIENKLLSEVGKIYNSNLRALSQNDVAMGSVSANVLLGDQEVDKTRTMSLIEGKMLNLPFPLTRCTSPLDLKQTDMDITKMNTSSIDNIPGNEMPCSGLQTPIMTNSEQSSQRLTVSDDKTVHKVWDMDLTNTKGCPIFREAKTQAIERNVKLSTSQDNTLMFSCDYNDMDMTRSHTIAIEGMKDQLKADLQINVQSTNANIITNKETTVELANTNDQENPAHLSNNFNVLSKDTHEESCDNHDDKTIHIVCNVEDPNIHFNQASTAKGECKVSLDKTVYNQGDMEITKSHTFAIESKALQDIHIGNGPVESCASVHGTVSSCNKVNTNTADSLFEEMDFKKSSTTIIQNAQPNEVLSQSINKSSSNEYLTSEDTSVTFLALDAEKKLKLQVEYTNYCKDNQTVFPNEQHTVEITKATTATVDEVIKPYQGPKASICANNGRSQMEIVKSSVETGTQEKCGNTTDKPIKMIEQPEGRSILGSTSLLSKTVMFSDDLGNMELTHIHAMPMEVVTENRFGFSSKDRTCAFSLEMDITKSNTVINQNYLDFGHITLESDDFKKTRKLTISSFNDCPKEMIVSGKSGINHDPDTTGSTLKCNSLPSDMSTENLTVGVKTTCDGTPFASGTPNLHDNGLPCELAVADYVLQTESANAQKDPEALQNTVSKKGNSKRVSFHFPERDFFINDDTLNPVSEMTAANQEQQLSSVPNEYSASSPVQPERKPMHITDKTGKSNNINEPFVKPNLQNNVRLKDLTDNEKLPDIYNKKGSVPEGICNIKDKRPNSIADIQLKLRRLTQTSSNHDTAPVSCFIGQLPVISQGPNISNSIPEQVLLAVTTSSSVPVQEKGNAFEEKDVTVTKKISLPNRLSVKIFQPKLPDKRHLKTNKTQEPISSSVLETQTQRTSLNLLKTLADSDGQCIHEESLPSSPDDQEIHSLFPYDVPEGAWEELCKKEALHKNLNQCAPLHEDSINGQKRIRSTEDDVDIQLEKKARRNEDTVKHQEKTSLPSNSPEKCSRHDSSSNASKTMEQTYSSSSSQDSRAEGMSVDLSSQQYSQMDSQLPWDTGCEHSLWQKFQDGTITAKEFFMLLRIRILIQKPRYSELPANRATNEVLTPADVMIDRYIYQPKLQVYEEECHSLYQTIEELKVFAMLQEKSLVQINSLFWEAMRMCSESELMYFGVKLKNLKAMYSKKSKLLAHERKISVYRKLLHTAQAQWKQLQAKMSETDGLLKEIDDCISNLEMDTFRLDEECRHKLLAKVPGGEEIHNEMENLNSLERNYNSESLQLKERTQHILTQLGSLQAEAQGLDKQLQEPSFSEWELMKWTDKEATFVFLHDSLEMTVLFGDYTSGEHFINQPCRRVSNVVMYSQLNEELAPPSTLLVHRLILQFIQKNRSFHETYTTQNDVPQLLFDLSLVVSRCKSLGEEIEYLTKWGAKYNLVQTQVQSNRVRLLFSSFAAFVKFELIVELSESYTTVPLVFTVINRIGKIDHNRLTSIMSKVPVGLWHLKRAVKSIYENLLV